MVSVSTREYTEIELEEYADLMALQASSLVSIVIFSAVVGGVTLLVGYGVSLLVAWVTSGTPGWTIPLIGGGSAAMLTMFMLWLASERNSWTDQPPELASDVTATADAAWLVDSDRLERLLIMRVDEGRYLALNEDTLMVAGVDEQVLGPSAAVGSTIRLVLLGEGEFRAAIGVSLEAPMIAVAQATAQAMETDPDFDDESRVPDGLYGSADLPASIRRAIEQA